MTEYYSFRETSLDIRGRHLAMVAKPGVWSWDQLNPGTAALLDVVEIERDDHVLDLGCGAGVIGSFAASCASQGRAVLVDSNLVAKVCALRTVEANRLTNAEVHLADGVQGLAETSFDVVLCHLPRGRVVQEMLIRGVARVLRPGGRLYLVASKHAGVKSAIAYAEAVLGRCAVIRQKKGYHVAVAARSTDVQLPPADDGFTTHTLELASERVTLISKPGVFAWDRLDPGTEALIGAMRVEPDDRILDLGCGTGLAGLVAARRASQGRVTLIDVDVRATESSRWTLAANGVSNAEVLLSDWRWP